MAKRAFDLVVALPALIAVSPVLAVLGIAIRLDSPGPVMFRQERIGRGGTPFRIHKLRTMRTGEPGRLVSTSTDDRITRVGRFLRKSKLDELPQLIDVVLGTMSLVGPRPEVPRYVALWPADARAEILSVRPGITDPASIVLRDESDQLAGADDPERYYVDVLLPQKAEMYRQYVRSRSLRGDVAILLRTVKAVLR